MVTVLMETGETRVSAEAGESLWLSRDETLNATGWLMKPEGFCKDDICVPTPAGKDDDYIEGDKVNVSAFWTLMGKPTASSDQGDVWFLGESAQTRNDALLSLQAPDFTLPDFDGKPHSLSDFRRKRVLLITWASW
jgi:hypothetical protein